MTVPINVICAVPYTHAAVVALNGWTRETTLDARYMKMIATSATDPGTNTGSDSHVHVSTAHGHTGSTHSHTTWPNTTSASPGSNGQFACLGANTGVQGAVHDHSVTGDTPTVTPVSDGPNWSNVTDYVPYLLTIFIKSDGTPLGFPTDAIVYANATPPGGWAIADGTGGTHNAVNKMLRAPATGADGGTNGGTGDAHPHTQIHDHAQSHLHVLTTGSFNSNGAGMHNATIVTCSVMTNPHDHSTLNSSTVSTRTNGATDTSTNGDLTPPWQKVMPVQNKSGSVSHRRGLIAMWLGTLASIPIQYKLCDGTGGTPNLCADKHVMGAANLGEVGNTGGATTHGHTGGGHLHANSGHVHAEGTTIDVGGPPSGQNQSNDVLPHHHDSGGNSSSTTMSNTGSTTPTVTAATNAPASRSVAFIQLMVEEVGPQILMSD